MPGGEGDWKWGIIEETRDKVFHALTAVPGG